MEFNQLLERLAELKTEIGELGKLPKEVLQKINYKFRLDWNYYSNRMEGGTLTREETRSVMVGNITVAGKPIKDVMEMNGHDAIVRDLLKMGKGELRISEKRIHAIHRAIMAPSEDEAINRQLGAWKEKPNEIINYKGEKISFTAPLDVPDEIHSLLNTTNAQLDAFFAGKKDAKHPLVIAADFHIGFVSIHPFFDGNGRTARILMNLILISCGYPPIIINDAAKKSYYQYLADIQGYGGDKDLFYGAMAGLLLRSLMLVKDAIAGKNIEDEDDLYKRLDLLTKLNEKEDENTIRVKLHDLDKEAFVNNSLIPLTRALYQTYREFDSFFAENYLEIGMNNKSLELHYSEDIGAAILNLYQESGLNQLSNYKINCVHDQYKKAGTRAFNAFWSLTINFDQTKYQIYTKNQKSPAYTKLYHQLITEPEIMALHKNYLKTILDSIDQHLDNLNNAK